MGVLNISTDGRRSEKDRATEPCGLGGCAEEEGEERESVVGQREYWIECCSIYRNWRGEKKSERLIWSFNSTSPQAVRVWARRVRRARPLRRPRTSTDPSPPSATVWVRSHKKKRWEWGGRRGRWRAMEGENGGEGMEVLWESNFKISSFFFFLF